MTDDAADALVKAVASARQAAAEQHDVDDMLAFATSAVRDATNSAKVLARVRDETGVELQVLSGQDEARLTFLAVRRWFGWSAGRLLVLDIGGGSLEIAAGIDEEPDGRAVAAAGRRPAHPGAALRRPAARRPRSTTCASTSNRQLAGGRGRRLGPGGRDLEDVPYAGPAGRRGPVRRRASGRRAR